MSAPLVETNGHGIAQNYMSIIIYKKRPVWHLLQTLESLTIHLNEGATEKRIGSYWNRKAGCVGGNPG